MKCPACGTARELKLHDAGAETVAIMACPRCLTTSKLPQPSYQDVMSFRSEVSSRLRRMGIAA